MVNNGPAVECHSNCEHKGRIAVRPLLLLPKITPQQSCLSK
jgi:hypothetical protein